MTLFPHRPRMSAVKELCFKENIFPFLEKIFLELSTKKSVVQTEYQKSDRKNMLGYSLLSFIS
jgi:hypothetical protein